MRFISGTKHRNITYVVRAARRIVHPDIGTSEITKPLRAEFRNHFFDSVREAERLDWTDAEREAVERHLQKHQDWLRGDGRGIMPDNRSSDQGWDTNTPTSTAVAEGSSVAVATKLRCQSFFDVDGGVEQCPNDAFEGTEYCTSCTPDGITFEDPPKE